MRAYCSCAAAVVALVIASFLAAGRQHLGRHALERDLGVLGQRLPQVAVQHVAAGCGSALRDEPRTPPLRVTADERVSVGQQVFMQHCYQCHPGGAGGVAPAINDKPLPVWLMKTQVRAGLGAMPGFSKDRISDEQLDALMVYLKALRATGTGSTSGRT